MTLRERIASRISPIKKHFQVETPILNEVPIPATNILTEATALPAVLGRIPYIIRGTAYGEVAGQWYSISFPRNIVNPSAVAVAEARAGAIPSVSAPKMSIASISIPTASVAVPSAVPAASVAVQSPIPIDIPTTVIPYLNESFPYVTWGYSGFPPPSWEVDAFNAITSAINSVTKSLYTIQSRINDSIGRINDGFNKVKTGFQNTNSSISDLRGKTQNAINSGLANVNSSIGDLRTKAEKAINDGLSKETGNVQSGLNATITNTQDSVNKGLADLIPALYAAWGLPKTMIITPIHIRNLSSTGFQFQSYGKTTIHWIAMGSL